MHRIVLVINQVNSLYGPLEVLKIYFDTFDLPYEVCYIFSKGDNKFQGSGTAFV